MPPCLASWGIALFSEVFPACLQEPGSDCFMGRQEVQETLLSQEDLELV